MSSRIAHRPRFRTPRHLAQPPRLSQKDYLRTRWTYCRQNAYYEKRPLGYSLSFIPFGYRAMRNLLARHA